MLNKVRSMFKRRTSSRSSPAPTANSSALLHSGFGSDVSQPQLTSPTSQSGDSNTGTLRLPGDGTDALQAHIHSQTPQSRMSNSGTSSLPSVDTPLPVPLSPSPSSGPSNSGGSAIAPTGEDTDTSEPPNSSAGDSNINQFSTFLGGVDAPQTLAKDIGGIAYEGFKGLLSILNIVGYTLPPLKAAAAGLSNVMTVIDNVVRNKEDCEAIGKKLEAIVSMAEKYKQHGFQHALDRRVEDLSTAVKLHTDKIQRVQERWFVRRAFENAQDTALVAKSFRDIGILIDVFLMDTMLHVEAKVEEIFHWLKYEDITRITQSLPHTKSAFYNTRRIRYIPGDLEQPGCLQGTREQILAELEEWALDNAAPKVYWLNGMAGTGKSSIAHSLCELLDEKHMLGASFFCSRSASQEVRNARLIIPTIAYKLSQASPPLQSAINKILEEKPDVGSLHTLSMQFRLLLVEPIQHILGTSVKTYKTVIVDALDECTEPGVVVQFIKSVIAWAPNIPLKFLISSRDIIDIRGAFHRKPAHLPKTLSLHNVEKAVVQEDIKTYLQHSFSAIVQRKPQSTQWPARDELNVLLERADRLFIYAATAIRYIGASGDFKRRLTRIIRLEPSKKQTEAIDLLYNDIMEQAFHCELEPDEVVSRRETLAAVVFLQSTLPLEAIASLLSMDSAWALEPFHPVIHVPTADRDPVAIFHASFRDFIVDSSRCEKHSLDDFECHRMLAVKCLRCLNQSLKRNICNLDINETFSLSQDLTIQDSLRYSCVHWASHLIHALEGSASVSQSSVSEVQGLLSEFVDEHLLEWFECLSALRELESGIKSLGRASEAISAFSKRHSGFQGIPSLLEDARQCLRFAFEPINKHPLGTYHSALVWIPRKSLMRQQYADTFRSAPQVLYGLSESWEPAHIIPQGRRVESIAFSPDSRRIVIGSLPASIVICNAVTGREEGVYIVTGEEDVDAAMGEDPHQMEDEPGEDGDNATGNEEHQMEGELEEDGDNVTGEEEHQMKDGLEEDSDIVGDVGFDVEVYTMTVAFSPDGSRIASGPWDHTVRIWNTATAKQEAELKGHTGRVKSVAFSHKGDLIVSGSWDKTVRVWNTTTYETELVLSGHSRGVTSVALSRNDKYVISGSGIIVRIWDITTGRLSCKLHGPLDRVTSVAVSSDSRHIAAASSNELWIWDVEGVIGHEVPSTATGMTFAHALHDNPQAASCHSRCLIPGPQDPPYNVSPTSVAFSPDGTQIVSQVGNKVAHSELMCVWCVTTGRLMRTLEGHSNLVTSVVFSPDGSRIASGSIDETVRIWDTNFHSIDRDDSTSDMDKNGLRSRTETQAMKALDWLDPEDGLVSCSLSPNGSRVVIGTGSGLVYVWNHVTNTVECELRGHFKHVRSVAFSNDESHVVSASADYTVRLWSCHTKSEISRRRNSEWVMSVAISPDGSRVAFGSVDMVQIWNPETGQIESKLETDMPRYIAFSHDGSYVVYGSYGMAWTWNVTTNETNKYTLLSGRLELPDRTQVYYLGNDSFHIYNPADQKATNDASVYILSITEDHSWVIGEHVLHSCWIPPQYRNFIEASIGGSTVLLVYEKGQLVVLDLKRTAHV